MPIFRTGTLQPGGWAFEPTDIEDNQSDDFDTSGKVLTASTSAIVVDVTDILIKVTGNFTLKNGVVGLSINEAIDNGLVSGQVDKVILGFYIDNVFSSAIEISDLNKSLLDVANDFNTDDFMGFFSGNDEIYGNDLRLLDDGKEATDIDGAGNVFNGNRLHGYNGNDKVYGGKFIDSLWGDKGNDSLVGYAGNDFLYGGVGSDVLIGGDGNDKLNGGTGSDKLYGGRGNDTLHGLTGSDSFIFDTTLSSINADTIRDFSRGTDKIVLDDDVFTKFSGKTSITSGNLIVGTKALQADDFLIYDTSTDKLFYDADGSGRFFGNVEIAKVELAGVTTPTHTDIQIID
jgi:Ca2+-binding RTX toxin-like protein